MTLRSTRRGGFDSHALPPRPPSVETLLARVRRSLDGRAHEAAVDEARRVIQAERERLESGLTARPLDDLAGELLDRVDPRRALPINVINATGVILHTNLGRASWPAAALEAAAVAAAEPIFLELDRATGSRGRRYRAAEDYLISLTASEDALVTNNNAAAVALAVGLAGPGGGVIVSRGELVEIGGGVRIPEIVLRAGAMLIEVGTTNRTRAEDFRAPLSDGRAKVVLRVHRSNFRHVGFVEDPSVIALNRLVHEHGGVVVDDLGSGALLPTERFGLPHEPTPRERLAAGADVVMFSGDKLVGGPQAGLICGRANLITRLRADPMARAMRPDKVTLAAVAATLALYTTGLAQTEVPVWRQLGASVDYLRRRAQRIARSTAATPVPLESTVGGGSMPGETIPSYGLAIVVESPGSPQSLLARLRVGDPPVVARIEDDRAVLDLRTVEPARDRDLTAAVVAALSAAKGA